jgi:hypothetical protein
MGLGTIVCTGSLVIGVFESRVAVDIGTEVIRLHAIRNINIPRKALVLKRRFMLAHFPGRMSQGDGDAD